MADATRIEWCDATFNPWVGCTNITPGCGHCYARTWAKRTGSDVWFDSPRRITTPEYWRQPFKWVERAREGRLPDGSKNLDGHRPRIFCASLADVFEDRDELTEPRAALFDVIRLTPELDWLVLTKRPEVARDELAMLYDPLHYDILEPSNPLGYLPNVWLGTSIENARYTWRADVLREIPAAVRFISAEPLLGSLFDCGAYAGTSGAERSQPVQSLAAGAPPAVGDRSRDQGAERRAFPTSSPPAGGGRKPTVVAPARSHGRQPLDLTGIDWVIIGGESGPKARPMQLEWAREIVRACDPHEPVCCGHLDGITEECCGEPVPVGTFEARPAVFVKQLGAKPVEAHPYIEGVATAYSHLQLRARKGGDWTEWPADLRIREFPASAAAAVPV